MKFCVNCKHYKFDSSGRWKTEQHLCLLQPPNVPKYDMVTGEELIYKHLVTHCVLTQRNVVQMVYGGKKND